MCAHSGNQKHFPVEYEDLSIPLLFFRNITIRLGKFSRLDFGFFLLRGNSPLESKKGVAHTRLKKLILLQEWWSSVRSRRVVAAISTTISQQGPTRLQHPQFCIYLSQAFASIIIRSLGASCKISKSVKNLTEPHNSSTAEPCNSYLAMLALLPVAAAHCRF